MIPDLRNFSREEFPDSARLTNPALFRRLDAFREALGRRIHPSRHPDGWVRTTGSMMSRHHMDHADAGDIFCEGDVLWAFVLAQRFFNGVGIYFDTRVTALQPGPMLHVDLRPQPLIWARSGDYVYPTNTKAESVVFWRLLADHAAESRHAESDR